jgi:S1-C subfamily serine protease
MARTTNLIFPNPLHKEAHVVLNHTTPDAPRTELLRRLTARSLAAIAVGTLVVGAVAPSVMATQAAPESAPVAAAQAAGDNETVIAVAAAVSPAVVTIEVSTDADPAGTGPFGDVQEFLPFVQGSGSGVIIDADGLILTNRHVVADAEEVTVVLANGDRLDGTVEGVDTYTDLALVRVDGTDLPTAPLGESSALRIGQLAVAIGNPLGQYAGSVTTGIVSGLDRSITVGDFTRGATALRHLIQIDAAINPGNSGGALVDGDGNLIGINTAMDGGANGIGFAIPIDLAKPIIDQVRAGEEITRPWMGITYQDIDAQLAEDEELGASTGAWIHADQEGSDAVLEDSPAADAGLQDGDIVVAVNDQAIDAQHPLDLVLLGYSPDETVTVTVLRDGSEQDLQLTLGTRPADLSR